MTLLARHGQLARYGLASALALAGDYTIFVTLLRLTLPATPASLLAYTGGIAIHWLASSRAVFPDQAAPPGAERNRQKALFIATALAGLGLTGIIVALGTLAGFDPRLAKLAAVAASFLATWHLRRHIVFA